ncbi:hypothetical protein LB505_009133 [Fusarium chuoi]|nr:hypothetical protein LB505_009133 [Fusarium chuoi]
MNWGYKTAPQEFANNRELDYSRGKGLGGSSAINFGVYSIGARDDYEEWARIVDDDAYRWDKIHGRYKSLETFHGELPEGVDKKRKTTVLRGNFMLGMLVSGRRISLLCWTFLKRLVFR